MKLIGIVSTAVLSLAIAAPVYAQQEQHDQEEQKDKPAEKKAQPEKSAKQEEKSAQPEKNAKPEEKSARQPEKNAKPEEKRAQQPEKNAKPEERNAQQQDQEKNNKPEQRNAQQQAKPQEQHASGNGGGRIPDDRYKANFGQQHTFRVSQGDYNNHQYQYGGYSFAFVGAWPSNWLYTQNVYVIDIDGVYYLCNPMYPGVNIALDVNL